MMAATLANMGCHPIYGRSAFSIRYVKDILSIMFTRDADYSGQWAYRVGVPAKSGVAGGVMAVVNRQLGIGNLFAPARSLREQRPRHRGLHRPGVTSRPARLRLRERGVELPRRDSVTASSSTSSR